MQPDYAKLLFAAEVHKLAGEMRKEDLQEYMQANPVDDGLVIAQIKNWLNEHKFTTYVAKAYEEFKGTADQLDELVAAENNLALDDYLADSIDTNNR